MPQDTIFSKDLPQQSELVSPTSGPISGQIPSLLSSELQKDNEKDCSESSIAIPDLLEKAKKL